MTQLPNKAGYQPFNSLLWRYAGFLTLFLKQKHIRFVIPTFPTKSYIQVTTKIDLKLFKFFVLFCFCFKVAYAMSRNRFLFPSSVPT